MSLALTALDPHRKVFWYTVCKVKFFWESLDSMDVGLGLVLGLRLGLGLGSV